MKSSSINTVVALAALLISVPSLADTCTVNNGNCAKFDIPGAFPGDFYIDFQAVEFSWAAAGLSGGGSLSTESQISFHVGDVLANNPTSYQLSMDPDGFQFVDLNWGIWVPGNSVANIYAVGTGYGRLDSQSGDWELTVPFLLQLTDYQMSYVGNLVLSTLNPGGSAMILDPANSDWGKLTIVSEGSVGPATGVDQALYEQLNQGYSDMTSASALDLNFTIQGIDPVTAVPVPASLWLFGSALLSVFGVKRKAVGGSSSY